jgi:hydrogenase maturation protease
MKRLLVIAYGNPLRSDDGVAWQAAEELKRNLPASEVICVHQLTPELAETVTRFDLVIFLDAASDGHAGRVNCRGVYAESVKLRFSHYLEPAEIMALCQRLYSAKPEGFLITVHGERFTHGEGMSPAVASAIPHLVAKVNQIVTKLSTRG